MSKMNLLLLLDRLKKIAASNFHIAGKVVLDREELEELVNKIELALPEEIKQAEWVSREKERYLFQAREEAKKVVKEAETYAAELVRQDQILVRAEEEAGRIIEETKITAAEIETEARRYASQVLGRLEESLDNALKVVRQGRNNMENPEDD